MTIIEDKSMCSNAVYVCWTCN